MKNYSFIPLITSQRFNQNSNYEFHIAGNVRKKYDLDESLFSFNGKVIVTNFSMVRKFVQRVNSKRSAELFITNGEVNAIGLMDEIFHFILREYEKSENPGVFERALAHLNNNFGIEETEDILREFIRIFPPLPVYRGSISVEEYIRGEQDGRKNTEIALEELILLHLENSNRGAAKLKELFDDQYFAKRESYAKLINSLEQFFQNEKKFGPDDQDLFSFLRAPLINHPDDLEAQLDFVMTKWKVLIYDKFSRRIFSSYDLFKEDFNMFGSKGDQSFGGAPPVPVPKYKAESGNEYDDFVLGKSAFNYAKVSVTDYEEPEQFTPDTHWMPQVVLLAKNTYVWLDQLSKKYKRHIHRLDQVPDEELELLKSWNFNGLWLIGIWERSSASLRIKHIMGNIDAVASAYSLYDYQIAADLGGDEAYNDLNRRAKERGIRLASDMVPNHTGIYSKWVVEKPDYFVQSDYPPFPNYKFTGPNLSEDHSVQIRVEDGYFRHSDAAVVFQRVDNRTGEIKYLYHGNDGTNMPWNDTSQLNMMKAEVREAVIQKIFEVARRFSIIRFDAAMTLTKRHYSRLWFPEPGKGGDIPSRADYALTKEEFDGLFPNEFWREVVDRINNEVPETLLLAEAFWLMEGYFVRSLGMHRVYNSAFMHMMMKEENSKYRDLITNTLEFEPEILKRYVNFMSNPDEETAIKQFGTDDKYFGVALMMVTLPGLPMFGHGQVEGYTEKYGMEYRRAYYNEEPIDYLVERHKREIFPLMKKRYLFSQVEDFWMFDFIDDYGNINENVFAFTNKHATEKAIVFYNNKFETAYGKIFRSTPKLVAGSGDTKSIKTVTLFDALNLKHGEKIFYIYTDHSSKLEFLRHSGYFESEGYQITLNAFKHNIFLDFREVYDSTGEYAELDAFLAGSGVPSISDALMDRNLQPVHETFTNIFAKESMESLISLITDAGTEEKPPVTDQIKFVLNRFNLFANRVGSHYHLKADIKSVSGKFREFLLTIQAANYQLIDQIKEEHDVRLSKFEKSFQLSKAGNYSENIVFALIYFTFDTLKNLFDKTENITSDNFLTVMRMDKPARNILRSSGRGESEIQSEVTLLNIMLDYSDKFLNSLPELYSNYTGLYEDKGEFEKTTVLIDMLKDEYVRYYLGVNYYEEIWYYSKEKFEILIDWLFTTAAVREYSAIFQELKTTSTKNERIKAENNVIQKLEKYYLVTAHIKSLADESGYKIDNLIDRLKKLTGNGFSEEIIVEI